MKGKDGVKLDNVLISSQEDYEESDEEEYEYDYDYGKGGLTMDLHSVAGPLDLRDLIRGKKKVEQTQLFLD